MIQTQTLLKVSDNSGGKAVRCLKLLKKGNNPKIASVGDVIVVSVQNIRFRNRLTLSKSLWVLPVPGGPKNLTVFPWSFCFSEFDIFVFVFCLFW